MKNPSISFCVVTGGKRPEKLERLVRSIQRCEIPQYEIIIAGNPHPIPGTIPVHLPDAAQGGKMGILRNGAARAAGGDLLVSLDDDIILGEGWWSAITAQEEIPPIMTPKILLPDGTRFWDYAAGADSPGGQRILNYDETDTHLYMTGGAGWVMTRSTWEKVQWNDGAEFYKGGGEDTGFSISARAAGLVPKHNRSCLVFHDDWKYTGFGRIVLTRKIEGTERERLRLQTVRSSPERIMMLAMSLSKKGYDGDACDVLRLGGLLYRDDPRMRELTQATLRNLRGDLADSHWFWDGSPLYWETRSKLDTQEMKGERGLK